MSDNLVVGMSRSIYNGRQIVLAIESAIAGGSLSLMKNGLPVAGSCGDSSVSRAEDLIPNIESLLASAGVGRDCIDAIAVSAGPGSFTGLRIGLSTALGLSVALAKPHIGVPLFDAVAASIQDLDTFLIAIPIGRADICFQRYNRHEGNRSSIVGGDSDLLEFAGECELEYVACHPDLLSRLRSHPESSTIEFHPLRPCLAEYVGTYAARHPDLSILEPIYVQNPRFA